MSTKFYIKHSCFTLGMYVQKGLIGTTAIVLI